MIGFPYRGSLCMASAGTGTSSLGSQFFITQANYNEATYNGMKQGGWPQGILDQYKKYGGNIYSLYCLLVLRYVKYGTEAIAIKAYIIHMIKL